MRGLGFLTPSYGSSSAWTFLASTKSDCSTFNTNAIELATRAIALDDSYATAYALRAQLRLLKYVNSHDLSDANREAARHDIDIAQRLAEGAVATLQARSRYSALFGAGPEHAIEFLDSPAVVESSQADLLLWRAFFLCRAGRLDEGLVGYARAAELDPENPAVVGAWVRELWSLRRPLAAREIVRRLHE